MVDAEANRKPAPSCSRMRPSDSGIGGMYDFTADEQVDREALRRRLQGMSDEQLIRFGAGARRMCSPGSYWGDAPRRAWVIQLEEAVAEWRRRHGGAQTIPD